MSQLHKTKHAVIVGAGIAGLMSAIALHRQGIRVTLVERDPPTDPSLQPENAWDWKRTGVPQSVHPHFFMGRLRMHLQEFYPDLLDKLFEAGAGQSTLADYVHPKFRHRLQPSEQDARLRTLNCRRPAFELVVREYVNCLSDVTFNSHAKVTDIGFNKQQPAAVSGVHVQGAGGDEFLTADVVIDASGRSGALAQMLTEHGVNLAADQRDSGVWYFTRHYRLKNGQEYPKFLGLPGAQFADFTSGAFPADNGYLTVTLQVYREDTALVATIKDPDHFQLICERIQSVAQWVDAARCEPVSKVFGFGQMDSFWRKTVVDGEPQILNYFFVGDSGLRSNPKYGRGCTWSTLAAHDLAELLAADLTPQIRAIRYEQSLEERFRADWLTMRNIDRASERDFACAVNLQRANLKQRIQQYLRFLVEDAMLLEPALFREIWTGYNGFTNMDAWSRKPANLARVARAWLQRGVFGDIVRSQRGRLPRATMTRQ